MHRTAFWALAPAHGCIYPTALGTSSKGSLSVTQTAVSQKKLNGSQGLCLCLHYTWSSWIEYLTTMAKAHLGVSCLTEELYDIRAGRDQRYHPAPGAIPNFEKETWTPKIMKLGNHPPSSCCFLTSARVRKHIFLIPVLILLLLPAKLMQSQATQQ